MARPLTCGRTLPGRGEAAGAGLRKLVRNVCGHDRRVKPFHPSLHSFHKANGRSHDFHFQARPLPPIRLPDGSYPFAIDRSQSDEVYSGSLPLQGPTDPLVELLWGACLDARPLRARLGMALLTPETFDMSVRLGMMRHASAMSAYLDLTYLPREAVVDVARRILAEVGLDHRATPEQLRPAESGATHSVRMTDLPAGPSLLSDLRNGLERLGWTSPDVVNRARFSVVDSPSGYMSWRGRLNALAGGWHSDFPGWYRDGFDPFLGPPGPLEAEEYRYPVAAYVKKHRMPGEDPTIQIDVVHAREGTFLEFQSAEGPGPIRKFADLAGMEIEVRKYAGWTNVELEMWDGPAADRWAGA